MFHDRDKLLFKWRNAFASKHGPAATTRLVLWTLSKYMDNTGGSCFPSTDSLAEAAGVSVRAVYTHLQAAEKSGWIVRSLKGLAGRNWRHYQYQAQIPDKVLNDFQHYKNGEERGATAQGEGEERGSTAQGEGEERGSTAQGEGEERGATAQGEGEERGSTRCGTRFNEVLNEVPTNSPTNSSITSPTTETAKKILAMGLKSEFQKQCGRLQKLSASNGKKFNVDKFIRDHDAENFHPRAIIQALTSLADYWDTTRNPLRYVQSIIKRTSEHLYEKEQQVKSQNHKNQLQSMELEEFPRFEPSQSDWAEAKKLIKRKSVK